MVWHKRIPTRTLERLGRRKFLSMSAASAALLPFVPKLEHEVQAAGTTNERLVVFHTPNGSILRNWRMNLQHGDALPENLSEILQPLAPMRDRLILLDGIDNMPTALASLGVLPMLGKGHDAAGSIWTQWAAEPGGPATCNNGAACGWPNGPSFDQLVASRIGGDTPYASINPSVYANSSDRQRNVFYDLQGQPVVGENNPRVLFDRLFADLNLDPEEKQRLKARKLSVIDSVLSDINSLKTKLSAADKRKLDAHLTGVAALEHAIEGLDTVCEIPDRPPSLEPRDNANLPTITDLQIELLVNALSCDLTRVVAFKWGQEGSTGSANWLGQNSGIHTVSHWEAGGSVQTAIQWMTNLNRWFAEKFGSIAQKLEERGVLDGTLLVWGQTMCEGAEHNARNIPMVVLQGEGYFETGRYLKYGNFPTVVPGGQGPSNEDYGGESMNRFITSMCHSMGLDDIDTFGDAQFGQGTLPDL